jgi:branched-chain amino acid transport system substrate-binding protein
MNTFTKLAIAGSLAAVTGGTAVAQELHLPNLSYRTGPFAATGTPIMNGQRDYMIMLNERDGGIGGIPVNFEECETGYNTEKGVECYERLKATALVTQPWSTGITLQVLPKTNVDQIPIFGPGYGFSPMSDGRTFQWAFNPPASYWDGAYMILDHLAGGDLSTPERARRSPSCTSTIPTARSRCRCWNSWPATHGFELLPIPVGLAEMQNQAAQWLQIRRERPDFVVMWGWGAMNAGAITEAVKTRYPMDQFVGIWWAGHSDDLQLVGEAGKGYRSISWSQPKNDAPVMADIQTHVVDTGKSLASDEERSEVFYQRGLVISMMLAEGVRTAQEMHGTAQITPAQLRDGLANLNITAERLEELGMTGWCRRSRRTAPTTPGIRAPGCSSGTGRSSCRPRTCCTADRSVIDPIQAQKAAEYAAANAPWPMNETCNPS